MNAADTIDLGTEDYGTMTSIITIVETDYIDLGVDLVEVEQPVLIHDTDFIDLGQDLEQPAQVVQPVQAEDEDGIDLGEDTGTVDPEPCACSDVSYNGKFVKV